MTRLTPQELKILNEAQICLLGYGAQGRAEAINLKKSGVSFSLVVRREGPSWLRAEADGMHPMPVEAALFTAETIVMNLPDQNQAAFYRSFLAERNLKRMVFAHGFNTHFKLIPVVDGGPAHLLVAPKGAASGLLEFYGTSSALPAVLAIEGSKNEEADVAFAEAYAKAIGCHSNGLIWATFKDETECDLFSEQALLCGGVSSLLRRAYEVLVEAGYNPETAYLETLFELKLIVDLIWKNGISGMRSRISPTARYGDITRGDRVIDQSVKARMNEVLKEIQSGAFAKEFLTELTSERFAKLEASQREHSIERQGQRMRERLKAQSDATASRGIEGESARD